MAAAGLLQTLSPARLAPCLPAAASRRHPVAAIAAPRLSAASRGARRAMLAKAAASAQAQHPAGPAAGEDFEGLNGFEDRRVGGHEGAAAAAAAATCCCQDATLLLACSPLPQFLGHPPCRSAAGFACAIMGDLHLEPGHQVGARRRHGRSCVGTMAPAAAHCILMPVRFSSRARLVQATWCWSAHLQSLIRPWCR